MSKKPQLSSYQTLKREWYNKLKETGFKDIEDNCERLKTQDRRLQNFATETTRSSVLDFFLCLDSYLNHEKDMDPLHREILELYSQGYRHTDIARKIKRTTRRVRQIIELHRPNFRFST